MKSLKRNARKDTQDEDRSTLEALGQSFLARFGPLPPSRKRKADIQLQQPVLKKIRAIEPQQEEALSESSGNLKEGVNSDDEVKEDRESISTQDDEEATSQSIVPVIVFDGKQSSKEKRPMDKAFMARSSKISKIRQAEAKASTSKASKKEKQEEVELQANDRGLYKLIHTKLLTASLEERSLDMGSAKKKKSLEGRVLEIANAAKLGKGETTVRKKEHSRAPRTIKQGIQAKRKERNEMKVQEAKDAGNYHPAIKKLLENDDAPMKRMKRERGIGMGVGSFKGGILTLGKHEIRRGQGVSSFNDKKGRKPRR